MVGKLNEMQQLKNNLIIFNMIHNYNLKLY